MGGWLAGRLLQALVVLGIKSFVIYALIGLMPGDPVDIMIAADPRLAPEDAARLRALYGLDLPIGERYLNWLGAALAGDFGYSRTYNRPVLEILLPRLANTLLLLGIAAMLAIAVAVMAGIVAALRPRGIADAAINFACFAGVSVPPFWLALVLIIVFAVTLGWLPAGGMGEAGAPWSERAVYLVLPVVTLMAASLAAYTRFARSAMIEALRQDWIRTARAKGAGPVRIVAGHALRNAMPPLVTVIALDFGTLFSGALITETMFGWLGMGKLIYDLILGNDFNTALVALLFATGVVLVANVLADIAYAALDPHQLPRAGRGAMNGFARFRRRFLRHRAAVAGLAVLVVIALAALVAPLVEAALGLDATQVDLFGRYAPPGGGHLLGTDEAGRDVMLRLLYGGQVSLAVGLAAALGAALIGTIVGLAAGTRGGRTDALLMRLTDAVIALPVLPLLIVLAAVDLTRLGVPAGAAQSEEAALFHIVAVIALVGWTTVARLVRAGAFSVRIRDYVRAAEVLGALRLRVAFRHVLPNVVAPVVVATTLAAGNLILLESVLSFLGLGIQPPVLSWGNMLSNAQETIARAPALALWPGACIFATGIALNFLGDGLQDALDPRAAAD